MSAIQSKAKTDRPWWARPFVVLSLLAIIALGIAIWIGIPRIGTPSPAGGVPDKLNAPSIYRPSEADWAKLTIARVENFAFSSDIVTEGKIQVDEDHATPIFSPYAGRVIRIMAKPGDVIERGQLLFVVEATDMVQAQNDFVGAITSLNKARSALNLAQIIEKRSRDLYAAKAVPLKDVQSAQDALVAAQNDRRSTETALAATRNRLRILGRSEEDIDTFEKTGRINPDTPVYSPLPGTVVQRKVGPGQYVSAAASDPVFLIGDLSDVWLTAFVREPEIGRVAVGERINFTLLAYPDRVFAGRLNYVSASIDPASRRLLVRAMIDNGAGLLKPEMLAIVTITVKEEVQSAAVPSNALIFEGSSARVWIVRDDKTIALRSVKTGMTNGPMVEVVDGLKPGDRIVTSGALFIDRVATGG